MTLAQSFIGIDISKAFLDVFDETTSAHSRIANDGDAIAKLVHGVTGRAVTIIFEATGSYDRTLALALEHACIAYVRVNPARARDFARASGYLAKTDAIDARMLAAMGRAVTLKTAEPTDPMRTRLATLHKRRDQLVEDRADDKKRLLQTSETEARASIHRHVAWLKDEIGKIEKTITALIASCPELLEAKALLETAPGVGKVTAVALLAGMPELGHRSAKAIAALAGLAPLNNDSGAMRGRRTIKGGRNRIRRALYMAALSAIRACRRFKAKYDEIAKRSASAKVAIIAIARKLLVALNAMAKTNQPFRWA